jgi:hypothetical protein
LFSTLSVHLYGASVRRRRLHSFVIVRVHIVARKRAKHCRFFYHAAGITRWRSMTWTPNGLSCNNCAIGAKYTTRLIDAMDANEGQYENMLPRTELFGAHYPNLLIPVERADKWQASGEHVDGACFQVALASCRLPETVRLRIRTIICKRIAPRRLIAT